MSSAGQIAPTICKNFAQNAWKKDLCSNCFKSEVEHQDSQLSTGGQSPVAQAKVDQSSDQPLPAKEDSKWKTSTTHPNLLSQTNGNSNQPSIKPLNININQTIVNKTNKSVNDCQNTTTTVLQSSKKPVNPISHSPQILKNTKKLNSAHVVSQNNTDNCVKLSDKPSKDSIKDNNLNNNSINNCLEFRKVINSKLLNGEESHVIINSIKTVNNNNNNFNNHLMTKDPKLQNFPQLSTTKDRLILSQTNVKNNNSNLNNIKSSSTTDSSAQVLNKSTGMKTTTPTSGTVANKAVPLISILKTESNRDLIKYRKKNKCLVFKEGDPMVIGIGRPIDCYVSDDEYSEEEPEEEESDDFDDDEQLYYSDDKELRELTRLNTKFNSNFANFSINKLIEDKVKECVNQTVAKPTVPVVDSEVPLNGNDYDCAVSQTNGTYDDIKEQPILAKQPNSCVNEVNIPEVCEKLVQNSLIETFDEINDTNNGVSRESIKSLSPDSSNSDILPMSTSSDSYSSSSSDEKDDSLHIEDKTIDTEHYKTHLIITQNLNPELESKHSRTDSESDNWSSNSDSGLEIKEFEKKQEPIKPQNIRIKPQLPVKPNISTIVMNSTTICVQNKPKTVQFSVPQSDPKGSEDEEEDKEDEEEEEDNKSDSKLFDGEVHEDDCESIEDMVGTEGKFSFKSETNNSHLIHERPISLEAKTVNEAKREIKLAELAHELELVRTHQQMKRPAPQPPVPKQTTEIAAKEDVATEVKPIIENKQTISTINMTTDRKIVTFSSTSTTITSSSPTKPHRFSIRKLLHKKSSSDKLIVKARDHSNDSQHSINSTDSAGADRKAWKQSEFDRTNLKIVHPIDLSQSNDKKTIAVEPDVGQQTPEQRPEAPPRTPKPNRPSVPARRRKSSNQNLLQPRCEPPPPPPPTTPPPPLSSIPTNPTVKAQVVEPKVTANQLNEAYHQLAKSNYSNLLAIKTKIESISKEIDYKWCDFEVTNGVQMGSALLYRDSVVSKTRKSVNLLVLPDCYCAPIVTRFRHHSDLVLVLDEEWTEYQLLSELSIKSEPKLMNSLILQLYLILETLEENKCNHLPNDLIDEIIICTTKEDCLLIVPFKNREESCPQTTVLTLHQFLAQVLEKMLPNSLFGSLDLHLLSRPSITISQSKTIVQLIVFQIPVHQMNDADTGDQQINYWFDINRSKFINQFCCQSVDTTKLLTHLDYNYLNFLCNNSIDLIRNSIALLVNTTNDTISC